MSHKQITQIENGFHTCLFFLAIVAVAVWKADLAVAASPGSTRPLRVAYLSTSATMASLWMAKETGALSKEGLEIEILSMVSSVAVPALVAGEVDAVQMSAAPVLTASLRGHDVVFVAGLLNTMIWNFYARPEIKSGEALKGKVIGTDRPATPVALRYTGGVKENGTVSERRATLPNRQQRSSGSRPSCGPGYRWSRKPASQFPTGARRIPLVG
jgi:NMT1/THI5 like